MRVTIYSRGEGKTQHPTVASAGKEIKMNNTMTRLELLTVLLSIQALLESDNVDKAKELISEVVEEAKLKNSDQ